MGQINPKAAAFAKLGFNSNATAHALNAFADNGKADASAVVAGAVEPFENAEDAIGILRRNADAVVFDPNAGAAILDFGMNADVGSVASFDEFEGIAEEIGADLSQDRFFREDGGKWLLHDDFSAGILNDAFALNQGVFPDAFQRDGAKRYFGADHAAVGEKIERHGVHLFGGEHDTLRILASLLFEAVTKLFKEDSGEPLHGAKGGRGDRERWCKQVLRVVR